MPERLLTIDEAADYLRYSTSTMYKLICNHEINCQRIGPKKTAIRFTKQDLLDYVNGSTVASDKALMDKAEKMLNQGE